MRAALVAVLAASALAAAACGSQGVHLPTAAGVSGTLPKQQQSTLPKGDPVAGKQLFAANGCGGCHTFKPAGSSGTTGPDLDKLPQYAKQANQGPLPQFVEMSITTPSAYVQPGYQDVMPKSYNSLPKKQLADLVAFLTQK